MGQKPAIELDWSEQIELSPEPEKTKALGGPKGSSIRETGTLDDFGALNGFLGAFRLHTCWTPPLFPPDSNSFLAKFGRKSFSLFAELALFPEGNDCADYINDNKLGDARGDALGGLRCPSQCRYQDSV